MVLQFDSVPALHTLNPRPLNPMDEWRGAATGLGHNGVRCGYCEITRKPSTRKP